MLAEPGDPAPLDIPEAESSEGAEDAANPRSPVTPQGNLRRFPSRGVTRLEGQR